MLGAPKARRVVFFESVAWEVHLLTSIELALKHAAQGWSVDFYFFRDAFNFPESSIRSNAVFRHLPEWLANLLDLRPEIRTVKLFRQHVAEKDLSVKIFLVNGTHWLPRISNRFPRLETLSELRGLKISGLEAGPYLASSLISLTSSVDPSLLRNRRLVRRLVSTFKGLAEFGDEVLKGSGYERLVVFNGRFVENGVFVELGARHGTEVFFHERAGFANGNFFFQPWRTHEVRKLGAKALADWNQLSPRSRSSQRRAVSDKLREAESSGGLAFRSIANNAPSNRELIAGKPRVVFFTSTEGEFDSLPIASRESSFDSQLSAVLALSQACRELDYELSIRVHPNVSRSSRAERFLWNERLQTILHTNCVYRSDDKVNSYDLIRQATLVAVWQSSVGLESVWRGIPTVSFVETPYEWAGCQVVRIRRADALVSDLRRVVESSPNPESALPFARYMLFGGDKAECIDFQAWSFGATRSKSANAFRRGLRFLIPRRQW